MQLQESSEEVPTNPGGTSNQFLSSTSIGPELEVSPIVVPLRDEHLKKASKSWVDAFEKDPVHRYIDNNRKQTHEVKVITQIIMFCMMAYWKRRKIALTVDGGAATIFCTAPQAPRGPSERCIDWMAQIIRRIFNFLTEKEEKRRAAEVKAKIQIAVSRSLGDRVKNMLYVDSLATEPASQGWGYGGALLESVGVLGDVTNQAIWLCSSNEKNTGFYMSHGYSVIDEAIVGDNNPTWNGPPVPIKIMVREPHQASLV